MSENEEIYAVKEEIKKDVIKEVSEELNKDFTIKLQEAGKVFQIIVSEENKEYYNNLKSLLVDHQIELNKFRTDTNHKFDRVDNRLESLEKRDKLYTHFQRFGYRYVFATCAICILILILIK
jgi:hypothetical protein